MSFNPDLRMQVREIILSYKTQKSADLLLKFNNKTVTQSTTQRHSVMFFRYQAGFPIALKGNVQ